VTTPSFRVDEEMDVELQELYVTVTSGGTRILDLAEADFSVTDDGAPQRIATFARGDVRLTAAILVDASASMKGHRLQLALAGATAFVEGMAEVDEAALLVFSDRLLHMTPFSADPAALTEGLASVPAAGGTALNDHLYLALRRLEEHPGRRVVILLTDGVDGHSALTMRQVQWNASRSRALVYWLRSADLSDPRQQRHSAWKDPLRFREDYQLLAETVTGSGGRIVTLPDPSATTQAMREILAELREQYIIGYHPDNNRDDGRYHRVRVGVRGAGLQVRARGGYVDD
jgi:Ca-activated chloride channel family protein